MASVLELEQEVRELRQKVESLVGENVAPHLPKYPDGPFTDRLRKILCLTRQLFPGPVQVELQFDPEVPNDPYVVFTVEAQGDPKEIVSRELKWHIDLRQILDNSDEDLRLSVKPQ